MAKHHVAHNHAPRYTADKAQRWKTDEAKHTDEQPSLAEQARILLLLETNPAKFREAVQPWLTRNPSDTMELGSAAPMVMRKVDFTPYSAKDLQRLSFKNISFVEALLTDEAQTEQLFAAGASVVNSNYGEEAYSITRKQPAPVVAEPPTAEEERFAGRGQLMSNPRTSAAALPPDSKARADAEAAGVRAMLTGSRYR